MFQWFQGYNHNKYVNKFSFNTTALKGCWGIVFTYSGQVGGQWEKF